TNPMESHATASIIVFYSLGLLVGLPLNVLSLWVLLCRHGLQSPNTVIMTNLAVSDLLLILTMPFRIFFYAMSSWPFGDLACKAAILVWRINVMSSCFFITFISIDRMLALSYPLRSRTLRTPRLSWIACAVAWLIAVAHCLPEINCKKTSSNTCFNLSSQDSFTRNSTNSPGQSARCHSPPLFVIILIVCLISLLVINLISTAAVIWTLHRRQSGLTGHSVRKIILLLASCLFIFSFIFLPFVVTMLFSSLQEEPNLQATEVTIAYASLNCCLDPIVYYLALGAFWKKKEVADDQPNNVVLSYQIS
ncbi:lysophosphatidic acid receptor 4-like, partial [Arapaima gigas]